jgi:two-component system response regulator FixJ
MTKATSKTTTSPPEVIHVVDTWPSVRQALSSLLETTGYQVATYPNSATLLQDITAIEEGCIILGGDDQALSPMQTLQTISRQRPDLPVIMLSARRDMEHTVLALKAGASDFMEKPFDPAHLLESVHQAVQRQKQSQGETTEHLRAISLLQRLTPREGEILKLIMQGESSKAIARLLNISPRTIDVHRGHIMEKLEARSVTDAVRTAMTGRFGQS